MAKEKIFLNQVSTAKRDAMQYALVSLESKERSRIHKIKDAKGKPIPWL